MSVPWSRASTFREWILKMIREKKTQAPEFQAALQYWGKKVEEIWILELIQTQQTQTPEFKQFIEKYGREALLELWKRSKDLEKKDSS